MISEQLPAVILPIVVGLGLITGAITSLRLQVAVASAGTGFVLFSSLSLYLAAYFAFGAEGTLFSRPPLHFPAIVSERSIIATLLYLGGVFFTLRAREVS